MRCERVVRNLFYQTSAYLPAVQGIGAAIALGLARHGANIVIAGAFSGTLGGQAAAASFCCESKRDERLLHHQG